MAHIPDQNYFVILPRILTFFWYIVLALWYICPKFCRDNPDDRFWDYSVGNYHGNSWHLRNIIGIETPNILVTLNTGRITRVQTAAWINRCVLKDYTHFKINLLFLNSHLILINLKVSFSKSSFIFFNSFCIF